MDSDRYKMPSGLTDNPELHKFVGKLTEHVTADAYFGNTKNTTHENIAPSSDIRHWTDLTDTQIVNMSESQKVQIANEIRDYLKARTASYNRDPLEVLLLKIEYERAVEKSKSASTIDDYTTLASYFHGFARSMLSESYKSVGSLKSKYDGLVFSHREQQGLCGQCGKKKVGLFKKKCPMEPHFGILIYGEYSPRDIILYGVR